MCLCHSPPVNPIALDYNTQCLCSCARWTRQAPKCIDDDNVSQFVGVTVNGTYVEPSSVSVNALSLINVDFELDPLQSAEYCLFFDVAFDPEGISTDYDVLVSANGIFADSVHSCGFLICDGP